VRSARRRRMMGVPIALVVGLAGAACGSGGDSATIQISGSSTVEPISALAAEAYHERRRDDVNLACDGPGTGDGFELFCNGEIHISDASRAIEDEEAETCEQNGVEYVELLVAYDGVTVMTNARNDAVECLNFADLYSLIGPESEGVDNWSRASGLVAELGSDTELPDAHLLLGGPGAESGTYDSFVELALEDIAGERGHEPTTRTDYASSGDDNVVIANIEGSDTSLGWVGFAFAEQAAETVRTIPIAAEPGDECVDPSAETIADGSYPLSRPLYIYVDSTKAEDSAALADFVAFYLENLAEFVEEGGYVALPPDQAAETRAVWQEERPS
jgi:phosphate transport system substrate-binding protein